MTISRKELFICVALLAAIFIVSLVLRIALPWEQVFSGSFIKFTDNDAYFYMRLLDNLAANFPRLTEFDPYFIFPGSYDPHNLPLFFVYLMGTIAWLLGGGSPGPQLVDMVGVCFPAVLGALMVFPVFFIAGTVFKNYRAGLLSAALIALLPGEFLIRTLLGNTDIHVMEIFTTTLFMLFLILTVAKGSQLTAVSFKQVNRHEALFLLYATLAGLCLGAYLLSWSGALLFVLVSFAWLVIQFTLDFLKGKSADYLSLTGCTVYAVALMMVIPFSCSVMTLASLLTGLATSIGLWLLSRLLQRYHLPLYCYPVALLILAAAGMGALLIISPSLLHSMVSTLTGFFTWQTGSMTAEMQPLLIQNGSFTLALLWGNYTLSSLLALAGLVIIIYQAIRKPEPEMILLLTWSFIMLAASLAMRRFAYYLAVNMAVLSGYALWLLFSLIAGLADRAKTPSVQVQKTRVKDKKRVSSVTKPAAARANPARVALAAVVTALLIIYPNTGPLPGGDRPFFDVAQKGLYTQSDSWAESLDWLRKNTIQPLSDSVAYYQLFSAQAENEIFEYPASACSVLSWWDYGYWITRTAHRIPYSNPGSAQRGEQYWLLAQDETSASRLSANWGIGYIMVDNYMVDWQSGFNTICSASGQPLSNYCEIYYRPQGSSLSPTLLYYPEYYRTMAVRLYCFNAGEFLPSETAAISWELKTSPDGHAYKEITDLKTFRSYEAAMTFIDSQRSGNWRVVGKDPAVSPVPLEKLTDCHPVFSSQQTTHLPMPEVKIFSYEREPVPVSGDWNGDGRWETGLWQPDSGLWLLDINGNGKWEPADGDRQAGPFGRPFERPVTGDWNGDGITDIGTFNPAGLCFYLDYNGNGLWEPAAGDLQTDKICNYFGYIDKPLAGDWNGDGKWGIGYNMQVDATANGMIVNSGEKGVSASTGLSSMVKVPFKGLAGEIGIAGDWTGSGIYRGGYWNPGSGMFRLDMSDCMDETQDRQAGSLGPMGLPGFTPLSGDWNGDGKSQLAMWDPHNCCFYLDMTGDGRWNSEEGDMKLGPFSE